MNRYNFYCDVYIFTNHLKNLKKTVFVFKTRNLVIICFKSKAFRWYSAKLIEIKRNYFCKTFIERWCINLIKRFKERSSAVLKKLQTKFYIYADACCDKKLQFYMQNIFRYAKAANYFLIYHQCITTWNNLELDFRIQILKSPKNITLLFFFNQLNAKKSI